MDLQNLNVRELSKKELKTNEGGFFGPFRVGLQLAYRQMWGLGSGDMPKEFYMS